MCICCWILILLKKSMEWRLFEISLSQTHIFYSLLQSFEIICLVLMHHELLVICRHQLSPSLCGTGCIIIIIPSLCASSRSWCCQWSWDDKLLVIITVTTPLAHCRHSTFLIIVIERKGKWTGYKGGWFLTVFGKWGNVEMVWMNPSLGG